MSFHKDLLAPGLHSPFNWVYADSTERLAATGFVAIDVSTKKVALQLNDFSQWVLTNHSPITWAQTGGGAIADGSITLAKMANVATASVFYRKTAGTGVPEIQTLATLKTDLGLTGNNGGDQTIELTNDVTGSGTGTISTTIANGAVTLAKMANMATASVIYRKTAGAGAPEVQSLATLKTDLGLANNNGGDQTISITGEVTANGSTGALTAAIDKTAITNRSLVTVATDDKILFSDTSNAGALGYTTPGAIAALASSATPWPVSRLFALDFFDPTNSSWAVNQLANIDQDPTNLSAKVRAFDDTLNEGVGFYCYVPAAATNFILKIRGRARTAPASTKKVEMGLYFKAFPDNAAITAWSSVVNIRVIDIAVNAYTQYDTYTETLANVGLTTDRLYLFQLIRKANDATNGTLSGDYLLNNLEITFS